MVTWMSPSGSIQHPREDDYGGTQAQLIDTIQRIKAALLALGDLRPGALSEQYNTCRTPGNRSSLCKACTCPSATAHTTSSATATADEAAPRTSAPNTSTRSTPRSPTTANCANSTTNGSTPPSNWTASDAAHPDKRQGRKPTADSRRPFTSNRHGPSRLGTQTPGIPGLPGLRCPSTTVLRLV